METKSLAFILVMAAIAVVGLVVFCIYLVVQRKDNGPGGRTSRRDGRTGPSGPRWFEYLLAVLALIAVVVAVIVVIVFLYPSDVGPDVAWRGGTRSLVFLVAMLVVGAGALIVFVVGMIVRRQTDGQKTEALPASDPSSPESVQTPAGSRLLGLFALVLAFLLLSWTFVDKVDQYRLMVHLIYPAVLGVSLVLLFDKATRAWSIKAKGEPFREWVFCDAAVFLIFLGFLNLIRHGGAELYNVLFWDLLNLVLFFFVFWLVDRKVTRYRFLVAYGYFALAPILLLIWRLIRAVEVAAEETAEAVSWWSTVWPFVILAVIFIVIEVIALIATRGSRRQGGGSVRDAIFILLYGILLLGAAP